MVFAIERENLASTGLAGVAELVDALDLGSSVTDVGVQVLFPAPCVSSQCLISIRFLFGKIDLLTVRSCVRYNNEKEGYR